jgi:hypothetical protein
MFMVAAATGPESVCAGTFPPGCSAPFGPVFLGAPVKKIMIHNL